MNTLLRAALLVSVLAWPAATVLGQSAYQVAQSWGLLGSWLFTCSAPYSDDNPLYTYVWRNNQVMLDRDYGGNRLDSNTVTSIRSERSDLIEYVVSFGSVQQPQSRLHVWQKEPDGRRMRMLTNRNVATGQFVIQNGHFTDDGASTAWTYRCR